MNFFTSSSSFASGFWWQKTLALTGQIVWAKTLNIFSAGAQFVPTSLCLSINSKLSALISSSLPTPPSPFHKELFIKSNRWFLSGMFICTKSSYHIGSHVQINIFLCGWKISRSHFLSFSLASLIQRVKSITPYVLVKVVSCMDGGLLRDVIV